jgi:hypothetical protein
MYELRGADRAQYGENLMAKLSARLLNSGVSRSEERDLRRYRQFYQTYPQIREALPPDLILLESIGQARFHLGHSIVCRPLTGLIIE